MTCALWSLFALLWICSEHFAEYLYELLYAWTFCHRYPVAYCSWWKQSRTVAISAFTCLLKISDLACFWSWLNLQGRWKTDSKHFLQKDCCKISVSHCNILLCGWNNTCNVIEENTGKCLKLPLQWLWFFFFILHHI